MYINIFIFLYLYNFIIMANIRVPLQLFLSICTILQILYIVEDNSFQDISVQRSLYNIFIENESRTDPDYKRIKYLYSISEIKEYYQFVKQNVIEINKKTLFRSQFLPINLNSISIVNILYKNLEIDNEKYKNTYIITQNDNGPFDFPDEEMKDFLYKIDSLSNSYDIICSDGHEWRIFQKFSFENRGFVTIHVHFKNISELNSSNKTVVNESYIVHYLVIFLSGFIFFYTIKDFDRHGNTSDFINQKYNKNIKSHKNEKDHRYDDSEITDESNNEDSVNESKKDETSKGNKVKINYVIWNYLLLIGNVFQFFGALISIINLHNGYFSHLLIAAGCLLSLFSLGELFEKYSNYSLFYSTITYSLPMIGKILISTLPLFFGLVFFSMAVFPYSSKFSNFSLSTINLFALYQMDETLDVFKEITVRNIIIGVIFMLVFWIMIHIISRRIFVVLIEDSYVFTQMKNKQSWLLNHVRFDTTKIGRKFKFEENEKEIEKRLMRIKSNNEEISFYDNNNESFEQKCRRVLEEIEFCVENSCRLKKTNTKKEE